MADEPIKQTGDPKPAGNTAGNPLGQTPQGGLIPKPAKKRRRRRRRKKLPAVPQTTEVKKEVSPVKPLEEEIKVAGLTPEKKEFVKPEEPAKGEEIEPPPPPPPPPSPSPITLEEEVPPPPPTYSIPEAPVAEPVTEPKIEEPFEQKPEEPVQEKPSEFIVSPEEAAKAPVGWDKLKQAIKEDHEVTKKQIETGAVVAGAVVAVKAMEEPKAAEEKKPKLPIVSSEEDDEKRELIKIITKYVISGCVVIVIIVGLFFLNLPQKGFNFVKNFFVGAPAVQEQQVVPQEETVVPTETGKESVSVKATMLTGQNQATSKERFEQGVETALVTGQDLPKVRKPTSAIRTVFYIGSQGDLTGDIDRIASYMDVLIRLQNAFKTDIHEYLSKSPDRDEALALHIKELNDVNAEANETLQAINERKDEIKVEYNQVNTLKNQLEKDFFDSMDKLEGNQSNDILNEFIDVSKRYTALKAEYSALDKTSLLFTTAIKNMDARIKDIEYNRAALVKGVQVVDIKGSDLQLIIQEAAL